MTAALSSHATGRAPGAPATVIVVDLAAKAALVASLALVLLDPAWGNLEGKAPVARAVTYPMLAFVLPAWWLLRRPAAPFPWLADMFFTLTCFTDILGNRLDLYDRVEWFDDAIHFGNTALLCAGFLLLTTPLATSLWHLLERSIAFGMSVSLAWEVFEYLTFVTRSRELANAYRDTIGDLVLAWFGAVLAAVAVLVARRSGQAVLVGEHDDLDAVAQTQLAQDRADVRLDRGLAEEDALGDLGVGESQGDGGEDLALLLRERPEAGGDA